MNEDLKTLAERLRLLAKILDAYTDDVELSGSGDNFYEEEMCPIPIVNVFDKQEFLELEEEFVSGEISRSDLATLVWYAVKNVQRKYTEIKDKIFYKTGGGKYWEKLCNQSRKRKMRSGRKIFDAAWKLKVWCEKTAKQYAKGTGIQRKRSENEMAIQVHEEFEKFRKAMLEKLPQRKRIYFKDGFAEWSEENTDLPKYSIDRFKELNKRGLKLLK